MSAQRITDCCGAAGGQRAFGRTALEDVDSFPGLSLLYRKNLEFVYEIRGNEMFVNRKDKSITRASISLAFEKALELQKTEGTVKGPKKLNCFGASYLYPVFEKLGIIWK